MKEPKFGFLLLGRNKSYPIECIHYKTRQVTLQESGIVYNTVDIKNVFFDYSGFTREEIDEFESAFSDL